jgi:hypothetical protein
MTDEMATRLLEAIAANRLLILCGAGLSMSAPSSLPSAATVAQRCATKYQLATATALDAGIAGDIEKISRHFRQEGRFPFFIGELVPWADFKRDPNQGHQALADLLACGVAHAGVTTNFDSLVEVAAAQLGEPDFRAIVDVTDMPQATFHRPYLKLHGCADRSRVDTLWCSEQLADAPFPAKMPHFRNWLASQVLGRDLLFIGFWSDWAYLTALLATSLAAVTPQHVYLVDPASDATLEAKAPELWAWAHGPGITFHHEAESGSDFLDELRRRWSRVFLAQLYESSKSTYQTLFGVAAGPAPSHAGLSSRDLYALRRDLSGTPRTAPARGRAPLPADHLAGALHARLLASGATYAEHAYQWNGRRIRVISGQGQVLSAVKARFQTESPLPSPVDDVVCAGALPDPSPGHIVRATGPTTVVRGGPAGNWQTHDALVATLGAAHA